MAIPAVKGVYHNGKIEPLENIPYKKDMEVLIVFLGDGVGKEDATWDEAVGMDFLRLPRRSVPRNDTCSLNIY